MKQLILLALLVLSLALAGGTPEMYSNIPTYPPQSKIKQSTSGPKPGSVVPENGPYSTSFEMIEKHPPKLELMVRTACGNPLTREQLIRMAGDKQLRNGKRVIDVGNINGKEVELWIVSTTKTWKRTLFLKAKDGKYVTRENKVEDHDDWNVTQLRNPDTSSACHREPSLTETDLWNMAYGALLRIENTNR